MVTAADTAPKIQPPRDPFLRVLWKINHAPDLTHQERLAYLVLWRVLAGTEKRIGAALVAALLNTSTSQAANVLASLQRKGYIESDGSNSGGQKKRANRKLTGKLQVFPCQRSLTSNQVSMSAPTDSHPSAPTDTDLGVGLTRGCCVSSDTPTGKSDGDQIGDEGTVCLADLVAADSGGDG